MFVFVADGVSAATDVRLQKSPETKKANILYLSGVDSAVTTMYFDYHNKNTLLVKSLLSLINFIHKNTHVYLKCPLAQHG